MKNQIFMTTVSTLALTSASAGMAIADDAAPKLDPKFSLTLEGGFGRLDNAPSDKWGNYGPFSDKAGAGQDLAYTGAISLSRSVGENRDVRFGLAFGGNPSNMHSETSGYSSGGLGYSGSGTASTSVTNNFGFTAMDVDTGRSTATNFGNLTTFGGLRGLSSQANSTAAIDKTGNDTSSGGVGNYTAHVGLNTDSSFVGVGPRLGVGFVSKPFAGGFGVSAELAGAVVYGQRADHATIDKMGTTDASGAYGPVDLALDSTTESQIVKTMDAKASLDYHISDNATLSLGYQARQFWNVDYLSDPDNIGSAKNRLVDGAFIAFTTKF